MMFMDVLGKEFLAIGKEFLYELTHEYVEDTVGDFVGDSMGKTGVNWGKIHPRVKLVSY